MFKCLVLGLLCIVWCSCCAVEPISIKIVAINDFHGNLLSPGKLAEVSGQPASNVGGIDYLAAYVDERISHNPHHVVVAAGDLVGASPLISASYHDEASIEALSLLGLDLSSVGNHEFDEGVRNFFVSRTVVVLLRRPTPVWSMENFRVQCSSTSPPMWLSIKREIRCSHLMRSATLAKSELLL